LTEGLPRSEAGIVTAVALVEFSAFQTAAIQSI
jgi:hypothetical protein